MTPKFCFEIHDFQNTYQNMQGFLKSENKTSADPKKRTNEFVFTTTTNLFVCFLGELEDT